MYSWQPDRCVVTCDRLADAVQVSDVGAGGVDLEEVLLDLPVAVVTKLQGRGGGEDEEGEDEEEEWRHHCSATCGRRKTES